MTYQEMAASHARTLTRYYGNWMLNTLAANGVPDHEAVVGYTQWSTRLFLLTSYVDASA